MGLNLVDRPRPFVAHESIRDFLAHTPDGGMPSDHATAAFAIGTAICWCTVGPARSLWSPRRWWRSAACSSASTTSVTWWPELRADDRTGCGCIRLVAAEAQNAVAQALVDAGHAPRPGTARGDRATAGRPRTGVVLASTLSAPVIAAADCLSSERPQCERCPKAPTGSLHPGSSSAPLMTL
jgi:undecaprenyl-diphosphatase